MKKSLLLSSVLLMAGVSGVSFADTMRSTRSSTTFTNDTACITGKYLIGVDVGAASASGSLKIYNSTWTTTGVVVSSISLATVTNHYYGEDGIEYQGICYITTGNTGGVTFVYKK